MLKEPDLLKSAVARAAQVLQALLAEAPVIEFQGIMQNSQRSDHESDLLAYVKATGQTYVLSCKVKPGFRRQRAPVFQWRFHRTPGVNAMI
jgi:hypothetical protein